MRAISYVVASELGPRDLRQLKQKPFTTRHRKRRGSNLKRRPAPRRTCLHLSNIKRWPPKKAQNNKSLRANPSCAEIKPFVASSFLTRKIVTFDDAYVYESCWHFMRFGLRTAKRSWCTSFIHIWISVNMVLVT